jgi:RNA polymerase sigma-70 factor (ECF subfamily)
MARQREVVDAFFRAARGGDFDGLVALLDPDVVLREDYSVKRRIRVLRGAAVVAGRARAGAFPGAEVRPALVNGAAGAVVVLRGRPFAVVGFTIHGDKIVEIDGIGGPERVRRIAAAVLD